MLKVKIAITEFGYPSPSDLLADTDRLLKEMNHENKYEDDRNLAASLKVPSSDAKADD